MVVKGENILHNELFCSSAPFPNFLAMTQNQSVDAKDTSCFSSEARNGASS